MQIPAPSSTNLEAELARATTLEDRLAAFGRLLEIDRPVTKEVLFGALQNAEYARNLLIARPSPRHLDYLLANPPAVDQLEAAASPATAALAKSAAAAMVRWARTGFSVVDDVTLQRREDACLACPHLAAPERTAQRLVASKRSEGQVGRRAGGFVCDRCGCDVSRKIRLTSEACPDRDPDAPDRTRWGEPV